MSILLLPDAMNKFQCLLQIAGLTINDMINQRYRKEECIYAPWLMQPRPQLSSRQREELKQQAMYARAVHQAYNSEEMRAARRYLLAGR